MTIIKEDELTLSHIKSLTKEQAKDLLGRVEKMEHSLPPRPVKMRKYKLTEVIAYMLEKDAVLLFRIKLAMARNDILAKMNKEETLK